MTLLKTFFLLFALLCVSQAHYDGHECDHDDVEQEPEFLDIEEETHGFDEGRVLAGASPFRIKALYDYVKSTAPSSYANYIQNELFPPIVSYFQSALKVKYPVAGNLKVAQSSLCSERSTPSSLKAGLAADFVVYLDTQAKSTTQIANTKYCYLASGTKRPLVSRIMINRNMLKVANGDVLLHEKNMYVLMHELTHGLGFSGSLYKMFIDANGRTRTGHIKTSKINGKTRTFIDVPPLTEKLRAHFGCSSLLGALMENGGGDSTAASHYERKVFLYEYMTSGSIAGRKVSELTLALLEGSGWYVADYEYAEPFYVGKGQGCSFVTGTSCTNFDEFCSTSSRGCAYHGRGGGSCRSDSISDGCKFYTPVDDYDCENPDGEDYARLPELQVFGRSAGSKCFEGTLNTRSSSSPTSFCFRYTCSGSGASTRLEVQVGSKTITCTDEGNKTIDGYYGFVTCPDPETFCTTVGKKFCPRNCMGRGTCVSGKCQCNSGYSGVDCAL